MLGGQIKDTLTERNIYFGFGYLDLFNFKFKIFMGNIPNSFRGLKSSELKYSVILTFDT